MSLITSQKVDLIQGSPLWHEWRRTGIGASEVAAMMGRDKYKTPYQLWEEKCGYAGPQADNAAMRHGRQTEEFVRHKVEANTGLYFEPLCFEQVKGPLRASLDGLADNVVLEIKCPYSKEVLSKARAMDYPEYWLLQIQTQLLLSGASHALLAIWDFEETMVRIDQIEPDTETQKLIVEEAEAFWKKVVSGNPPETTSTDLPLVLSDNLERLFEQYGELDDHLKSLIKKKDEIKELIKAEAGDRSLKTLEWTYTLSKKTHKTYDWERMKRDGIDVDEYERSREVSFPVIRKRKVACSQQ